jgi:patatin-like phospholipase/acyl hydrolase
MRILLQIDGGAARGYLPVCALEAIEQELGKPILSVTDLMSGTSTGSIITGCLAAGVPVKQIKNMYEKKIPELFKGRFVLNPFRYFKGVFDRDKFVKALKSILEHYGTIDNKFRLYDIKNTTYMSTAYDLISDRTMFFKSDAVHDAYLSIVDVISWSALSAVYYFGKIKTIVSGKWRVFQDGGQGIKNCTLSDCLDEYEKRWPTEECLIISLGCGYSNKVNTLKEVEKWGVIDQIKAFLGQARNESTTDQVRRALDRANRNNKLSVFRIDLAMADKYLDFMFCDMTKLQDLSKKYNEGLKPLLAFLAQHSDHLKSRQLFFK